MNYFSLLTKRYNKYKAERLRFQNCDYRFFNFWDISNFDVFWFQRFVTERNINPLKKKINFFSVFGPRIILKLERADVNIFFSGEALSRFKKYKDYCIDEVDLALGFDEVQNDKYLRFPLWIMDFFDPNDNLDQIKEKLEKFCFHKTGIERRRFCTLIARHDENGLRKKLVTLINNIEHVDCAGKLYNNTDSLKNEFKDKKTLFLQSYKFNICPENTNNMGYVTEKLFESFSAGCIPIYWGANSNPEPEVINKKAVLFYLENEDNSQLLKTVKDIHENRSVYNDFIRQNPIMPFAGEFVLDKLQTLHYKISEVIKNC